MNARAIVGFAAAIMACGGPPESSAPAAPRCEPLRAPTVITIAEPKYDELHELYELPDAPAVWASTPEDGAAATYRRALAPRVGDLAPRALLERALAVFANVPGDRESANIAVILDGGGTIATPSCLERRLFARQAARFPPIERPTEFGAFVLRNGARVRIYFSSMDMVGLKIRREVTERVETDVASGYRLVAHLHSHPFLLDRKVGDRMWTTPYTITDVAGGMAPSLADAQLWNSAASEMSLEEGWITNGLDSVHVPRSTFPRFAKHGDERTPSR